MTLGEMREDLLIRFYDNTIEMLKNADAEKKQEILHEANNVFGFSCEKISCQPNN